MKLPFILVVIVAVLIGLVIIKDVASTPAPTKGQCILQHNILLPDRCVTGCPGGELVCTVTTRPYAIFFTQAASCAVAILCGSSGRHAPIDQRSSGLWQNGSTRPRGRDRIEPLSAPAMLGFGDCLPQVSKG